MKKISSETVNTFLNGHDPMEHIITIECDYQDDHVSIIYVDSKGVKRIKQDDFKPFVWVKNSAAIRLFEGNKKTLIAKMRQYGISAKRLIVDDSDTNVTNERLNSGYKYMFYATHKMSYGMFLRFFSEGGVPIYERAKKNQADVEQTKEYLSVSPVEQYMMQTGKRLFKGYDSYNDLHRLTFDLETQGLNPEIHRIEQIGIHTNKNFDLIIPIEGNSQEEYDTNEKKAIEDAIKTMASLKPDIIVGHNSENFDWNFLIVRYNILGGDFKEMSARYFKRSIYKKSKEAVLKLGQEVEYYHPTIIWGYIILDSLHAARRAQALDSSMKSSNLKYVTKYLDLKKQNRVYVPGDLITKTWNIQDKIFAFSDINGDWYHISDDAPLKETYEQVSGRYIVERYLLDDLWETDKVEEKLNESNFLVGKMLPTTFARACTMGTAGIWKLIMLSWCYENGLAIPSFSPSRRFTGGLSRLLKTGYVDRIVKLDYNSLYPSIILTWHISTAIDIMNVMLSFLEYILTQREKYKELKGEAGAKAKAVEKKLNAYDGSDEAFKRKLAQELQRWKIEKTSNDKKQLPLKIFANSFFGSYGAPNIFPFGDVDAAEKTTCIGRMSLRLMISHFTSIGYTPIVGDSVTYDTPIIVKDRNTNNINIIPICDIFNANEQIEFDNEQYRDFSNKPYLVLTRNGFKDIKYVYKHKTNKSLHRIETLHGLIDVTEDHSLFDSLKNEIKPKDIKFGDSIELFNGKITYDDNSSITLDKAWLFGYFMSCGHSIFYSNKQQYFSKRDNKFITHNCKKNYWGITDKQAERLEYAKNILMDEFNIKNHLISLNGYDLIIEDIEIAKYFSENFYTSYRQKKIPSIILNSSLDIKKAFINGFSRNICQDLSNGMKLTQKSKVAMAGLYFILKELNIPFQIQTNNDRQECLALDILSQDNMPKYKDNQVLNNILIKSKNQYVYDIAADGTFVNALGLIVCHNTDGFNFQMPPIDKFRYTDDNPYIGKGLGRNTEKGKKYTKVEADVAEFEDMFLSKAYNGGINKMGLGIDEYCDATINFARKNYADLMPDGGTKKVGNTIKSRKMSGYLEKFIDEGVDLLLHNNGYQFLLNYYNYVEKIYNYQIPIKDIASKGSIKKTLSDYKKDCNTLTKAGSKKSRQAWYELAIQNNLQLNLGETVYYINTGKKKGHADVKRITHYYIIDGDEKKEVTKEVEKHYKELGEKRTTKIDAAHLLYGKNCIEEDEIVLNCKLVPAEIINSEKDVLCSEFEGLEYNVEKYIDQFNKRITPLLVCFHPSIRNKILITNPKDKLFFTEEEAKLVNGFPNKETDQDTYEALMTPEKKEIEFWLKIKEVPPFVNECGINWVKLVDEYYAKLKTEQNQEFEIENAKYLDALDNLTREEIEEFESSFKLPNSIKQLMTLQSDMRLYFKKIPNKTPSTGGYIFDDIQYDYVEKYDG